jgi:hypothetical protein
VGRLKRVDPYIVVTVCVIVGILKRVDPYIVVCNYNVWMNPL